MSAEPTSFGERVTALTADLRAISAAQELAAAAVRRAIAALDVYAVAEHPDLADLNLEFDNTYPTAFEG